MTLQLYFRTHKAWEAMYEDCQSAVASIEFEQYIIRDDNIGQRFLQLFARKAREGVKVSLLFDRIGSRRIFSSPLIEDIRKAGGKVVFYHPIGWKNYLKPNTWFPRNHVKTMLIDSKIAYVGGVCLADYMRDWQDLHSRLTYDKAEEVARQFTYGRGRREWSGNAYNFRYCVSQPSLRGNRIYAELLAEIAFAKKSIYIATPYFMPPGVVRRALRDAARRGIDVRVLVTEQSDVPFAVHISRSYFPDMIKGGLRFFSYQNTVFHGKYTVVDDHWAMLGSTNMDYLSLLRNREGNLLIREQEIVTKLKEHFLDDLQSCRELHEDFLRSVSLRARMTGYLGRFMKKAI